MKTSSKGSSGVLTKEDILVAISKLPKTEVVPVLMTTVRILQCRQLQYRMMSQMYRGTKFGRSNSAKAGHITRKINMMFRDYHRRTPYNSVF